MAFEMSSKRTFPNTGAALTAGGNFSRAVSSSVFESKTRAY